MKELIISERLKTVASFLPKHACFADIGSDHAYLPCYVCLADETASAIAGEVNDGPYLSAKKTVQEFALDNRIKVRKGNGLQVIEVKEVNQVVIAGMGGSLIASILENGKEKLQGVETLILQPNVDAKAIRLWLEQNDFDLTAEKIVEEGKHIYEILMAEKKQSKEPQSLNEKELLFGPWLLKEKSLPFKKKWSRELKNTERILEEMQKAKEINEQKIKQFEQEREWIKEVIQND